LNISSSATSRKNHSKCPKVSISFHMPKNKAGAGQERP
jgi:hypothetical protein